MRRPLKEPATKPYGFSFIELAFALGLAGLLLAAALQAWRIQKPRQLQALLTARQEAVQEAMEEFFLRHHRYPCPADPALPESDPDAGREGSCAMAAVIPASACGRVFPAKGGGVCRVVGQRDTDGALGGDGKDSVVTGALPFEALGMSPADTYDAWSNKLAYAVTLRLTSSSTVQPEQQGTIALRDAEGFAMTARWIEGYIVRPPSDNYGFVVWSYGSGRRGGYTSQGVQAQGCGAGGPARDDENCDADSIFLFEPVDTTARRLGKGFRAHVGGAEFFDSHLIAYSRQLRADPGWKSDLDRKSVQNSAGFVGIGLQAPQSALHVSDPDPMMNAVRATETAAMRYCDEDGGSCFMGDAISGARMLGCGEGAAVAGFEAGSLSCPRLLPPASITADGACTVQGEYMKGIDAITGEIVCGVP
jgi:type II secretory pathway pseudopilin PulG